MAVLDRATGSEIAHWGLPGASANFPMAFDALGMRLFVGYRSPAVIATFDTGTGTLLGQIPSCGDADDVFYDALRKRVYVSCGEGLVAIFDAKGSALNAVAHVRTQVGARTALFSPELDRLFVAARADGSDPAMIWVFRSP